MTASLQRNLRLYPWYVGLFHAYFWLPVYFLFFSSKLDLPDVLYLESLYFASVVAMEVPSGWFSDMFGRKKTLVVASIFLCASYVVFLFSNSFEMFAIAQIFLATGIAFNSGTDTSFLLESTRALDKEESYAQREANATRWNFLVNSKQTAAWRSPKSSSASARSRPRRRGLKWRWVVTHR